MSEFRALRRLVFRGWVIVGQRELLSITFSLSPHIEHLYRTANKINVPTGESTRRGGRAGRSDRGSPSVLYSTDGLG